MRSGITVAKNGMTYDSLGQGELYKQIDSQGQPNELVRRGSQRDKLSRINTES